MSSMANANAVCEEKQEQTTMTRVIAEIEQQQQEIYLMLDVLNNKLMDSKPSQVAFEDKQDKCMMLRLVDLRALSKGNMQALKQILDII